MATFIGLVLLGGVGGLLVCMALPAVRARLAESALELSAAVAVGATAGSLYFSEVANFIPCELCWFQRITMYPLAVIFPMAAIRRDQSVLRYATVLASIGLVIAAYHVQLQWFPEQISVCEVNDPCTGRWVEAFGWMTIPQMAALSFALIITLSVLGTRSVAQEPQ